MASIKVSCAAVALAMGLLGATAVRADDQDGQHQFTLTQNFGFLTYRSVGFFNLKGAVTGRSSGTMSYYPGIVDQIDHISFGNVGQDRQGERIRHHEDVAEQDRGFEGGPPDRLERDAEAQLTAAAALEGSVAGRHGKPARGRRHGPVGAGARDRGAGKGHLLDGPGNGDGSHSVTFSVSPGGTYGLRTNVDGNLSYVGHTFGGISGSSGFTASFYGSSSGPSSISSGGAPSPEVNTLLGFFIVAGTVAYIKRRRGDEAAGA